MLQFLVSNLHGPWLVDVVAAIASMGSLVLFLRVWHPTDGWEPGALLGVRKDDGVADTVAGGCRARVGAVGRS